MVEHTSEDFGPCHSNVVDRPPPTRKSPMSPPRSRIGRAAPGQCWRGSQRALESAVLRGTIAAGTRLPSERDLAQRLGISRSTVVAAYDRLKAEGRAHTQRGSGTYAGPPGPLSRGGRFSPGHLVSIVDNRDGPRQTVEFTIAALPGSRELGPAGERLAKQLQKLSQRNARLRAARAAGAASRDRARLRGAWTADRRRIRSS